MESIKNLKIELKSADEESSKLKITLDKKVNLVGNIVHESVPVGTKEDKDNRVEYTWGECKKPNVEKLYHHHELLWMIGGYEPERGVKVAGHRGYYLTGNVVLLNQALINYALSFLLSKKYQPIQPPYFMKNIMAETAQLEEFDEALYHVSTGNPADDSYLIATSEQPISAFHRGDWLQKKELPKLYAGYSTCFRKEAGSYGKDSWGIFRIHQFEKVEQFIICDPEQSWDHLENMIDIAKDFYQSLELPYHVVSICSGALNNAAAKKYDLEAWFPTLGVMRELVSASNCTDYQSRAMKTRFGLKKMGDREKNLYIC